MSSVTEALSAMLSADADARSRLGAAQVAANASNANAGMAANADMFRAGVQGVLAREGMAAEAARTAAELGLRRMLAGRQFGLEGRRLGLDARRLDFQQAQQDEQLRLLGEQLGLERDRFAVDRDLKLGEIGQGPYAPRVPDMFDLAPSRNGPAAAAGGVDWFKSALTPNSATPAAAPSSANDFAGEFARRSIVANPGDHRMVALFDVLGQAADRDLRRQELDFKRNAASDPAQVFASVLPSLMNRPDFNVGELVGLRGAFRDAFGTDDPTTRSPVVPDLATATKAAEAQQNVDLLGTLGLAYDDSPAKFGDRLSARLATLTANDIRRLQDILVARYKLEPGMFSGLTTDHPGVALVRKLMDSPAASLDGGELTSQYHAQRQAFDERLRRESMERLWSGPMTFPY